MILRSHKLSKSNSFFLFGARGTGKSTLLKHHFMGQNPLWIDLLLPEVETSLSLNPQELISQWRGHNSPDWIVIDEVQKVPKILDVVHFMIENHGVKFALTGSSARKLKRNAANLLAGRAFDFKLYPLSAREMGSSFELDNALVWGGLPKLLEYEDDLDRARYLRSYVNHYLKEEIQVEQIVRKIQPFRSFLQVVGQSNGEPLNFARLAREAKIETKSVERYYEILSDTLLGFFLPHYHRSIRKKQLSRPKFYFFDLGILHALNNDLEVPLKAKTFRYGKVFEHFLILEIIKENHYQEKNFQFSYFRTHDNREIDLIIERPGRPEILFEIKSTNIFSKDLIRNLTSFETEFPGAKKILAYQGKEKFEVDEVLVLPWSLALEQIFKEKS